MNMRALKITVFSLFGISGVAATFHVAPPPPSSTMATTGRAVQVASPLFASRRSFVETAVAGAAAILTVSSSNLLLPGVQPAAASGGATAGGAYLLSAKQRYNERVKAGVKGFLSIQPALKNGDIPTLRTYFNSEDAGTWIDLSAAGYLLANAFRTTSNKAPDALPSVKAWKKFAGEVEGMTKALKKKDMSGALEIYQNSALAALDAYLAQVELPSASEI